MGENLRKSLGALSLVALLISAFLFGVKHGIDYQRDRITGYLEYTQWLE